MQRSQWLAALILGGAFAAGGVLGVAADRALRVEHQECRRDEARAYWDRIAREWKLTAEQRVVIDSLMDVQHRRIAALYHPIRPHMDSLAARARLISDSTQARLRLILTPEQQRKMDAMRIEARRRMAARRACRDQELAKIR